MTAPTKAGATARRVTQADRDAAADYVNSQATISAGSYLRNGEDDEHPLVQAFAAHREASQAELLSALRAWAAYDQLLRQYSGPLSALCAEDVPAIDAAYDNCVELTTAAIARHRGEAQADLLSALQALVTAVTFADPPKEFNGVLCHEARIPIEFVEIARAAIARATGGEA